MKYFQKYKNIFRSKRFLSTAVFALLLLVIVATIVTASLSRVTAAAVTIDSTVTATNNANVFRNGNRRQVFISDQVGYVFYQDSDGSCVYSKSTDAGATWGTAVQVDAQVDCLDTSVWYDRWTPGDNSGTKIYIITWDTSADDLWYNELDTSSDTLANGSAPVAITSSPGPAKTNTLAGANSHPPVVKGTDGVLYTGMNDSSSSYVIKCSSTCSTASNWSDAGTIGLAANDTDAFTLVPTLSGTIMAIRLNMTSNTRESDVWNGTAWSGTWTTIMTVGAVQTAEMALLNATVNRTTGDIYLVTIADNATFGTDDDINTAVWTNSSSTWTTKTDVVTNSGVASGAVCVGVTGTGSGTGCGIINAQVAVDDNTGDIYCVYAARSTPGTATTAQVYWTKSTDGMATWGTQTGPMNSSGLNIAAVFVNAASNERLFVSWDESVGNTFQGDTMVDLTPPTSSTLTQSAYHWYSNSDSITPTGSFASENATASIPCGVGPLRLRTALTVGASTLAASSTQFRLQYGTSTSGPWTDVSGTANNRLFNKLPDPATLPAATLEARSTSWSPNGVYMAVSYDNTPYINIYKRSGNTFTKLSNPATLPSNAGNTVSWSPDSTYMSVGISASPWIIIYKRSGDTFTKLTNPATLPSTSIKSSAWSSDGTYLALADSGSPFIDIYKRSGDTFTRLSDPTTWPAGIANSVAWSPDMTYLSVAHQNSPFVTIYKRSGDTFTKLTNPATLPAGTGNGVAWSPDGTYMSVAHNTSPFVTIYSRSGDTFTKLTNPATLPAGTGNDVAWSPDGTYMSVAHNTSPFVTVYSQSGSTFTKLTNPAILPTSTGMGVGWSPDGNYMSVAHASSPFITIYSIGGLFTWSDNPGVTDGATISAAKLSGSPILEAYAESSPTAANPNAISSGSKGEWDFAIDASGAPVNTYYFRMAKWDSTPLDTYTVYPTLTITSDPPTDSVMRGGTFFSGEAKQPKSCSFLSAPV
jgi:6-phosphogluconolactonase (cycloisomerase 2 family)